MSINSLAALATATPIALNSAATSSGVNLQTRTTGGIEDRLATICGQTVLVADHTAPTNIVANTNPLVFANAAGGNVTINLPSAAANTLQSITIVKVDQNLDTGSNNHNVAIVRAGSDTITLPWSTLGTPTATQLDLKIPGEIVSLYAQPSTTSWRHTNYHCPIGQCRFRAGLTGSIAIPTSPAKLAFNTVTGTNRYNIGSSFDIVNNRFVAPFPMQATFHFSAGLQAAAADTAGSIRLNGALVETLGGRHNINTPLSGACSTTIELTTNDQVEAWINSSPARTASALETFFSGAMLSRV